MSQTASTFSRCTARRPFERGIGERRRELPARVVDQDVDPFVPRGDRVEERGDLIGLAHVAGFAKHASPSSSATASIGSGLRPQIAT